MDRSYIQQYGQLEKDHWWFIVRQKIIIQTLQKYGCGNRHHTGLAILNVGAATGGSSNWLSSMGKVISLENDPLFLSYLQDQHLTVINASVADIPLPDDVFDLVCAFDVLEHVEDDERALDELIRVCKPGGQVCITVPAFKSLWGRHDIVNGHKRRYRRRQLISAMNKHDISLLYTSYFNTILFVPIFICRKMQWLFQYEKHPQQSDFSYFNVDGIVNRILLKVFALEILLLKVFRFPFGVSLITLVRKKQAGG